jgi:hypothetical protein
MTFAMVLMFPRVPCSQLVVLCNRWPAIAWRDRAQSVKMINVLCQIAAPGMFL